MMFETNQQPERSGGIMRIVLPAIAGVFMAGMLLFMYDMHGSIASLEANEANTTTALKDMGQRLENEDSTMRATTSALAEKMGVNEKWLRARTAELRREQKTYEVKLRQETNEQFTGVRNEQKAQKEQIEGVRTDLTGTRTDLAATKDKLDRTVGDLGVQSGLIAHTREDVEQLKRRGDRNIYEFTLAKGKHPTRVSNIALALRKTNPKRGKFTMDVTADDWTIEKRDRTMFEPMQFYTGRDRQLYEVVVISVGKDKVSGYLSTPKYAASQSQQQGQ